VLRELHAAEEIERLLRMRDRVRPTSRSGLMATIVAPRFAASRSSSACADGSCRVLADDEDQFAWSKSDSDTLPLLTPTTSDSRDTTRVVAHVEQSGKLFRAEQPADD